LTSIKNILHLWQLFTKKLLRMKTPVFINAFLLFILLSAPAVSQGSSQNPTAAEVIELIISKTGIPVMPNTGDIIREGNPDTRITGIITTMFPTMEILREAVARKCNLVISHEPLYWSSRDNREQLAGANDPVFLEKQKFINDNNLVVWRYHDYVHSMRPDGIYVGMTDKLGWKEYMVDETYSKFKIPETTLENLLQYLKQIFPGHAFDVIGNPKMAVSKVAFSAGASGSANHTASLRDDYVVIAGEGGQIETYEYVRDAVAQGRDKAVVFIGHGNAEEAGMNYVATWLKGFINNIPIHFVPSGPSFRSY
jgi:putative NIF3 family GTP cyclohydrolase 1 type 2